MSVSPLEIERPDPAQERVLGHSQGGLVVTGPPGSGKSAVLLERFARLVEGGTDPERVALFVLGRRAAREAREALVARLGRSIADVPAFTVHGFAFRVIGRRFEELGYAEPPQVLSAPEQYAVVREMLADERRRDWPRFGHLLEVRGFAQQVADFVLRAQERLLSPEEVGGLAAGSGRDEYAEVAAFYRRYLDLQAERGRTDFAGLLFLVAELLGRDPGTPYAHVLVDDYQDVTLAAEAILRAQATAAESVVVAADPDGHVFSYRGGSLEPLRRVRQVLDCRERVELSVTRRLGGEERALEPLRDPGAPDASPSHSLQARLFAHPGEEVDAVAHEILRLRVEEDVPWERMAVILRRYGPYLTALRHALGRHEIPFVVVAEASEVAGEPANRPVIDLLRYVFRPEARHELAERVLTSALGGFDPHAIRALRRAALPLGMTLPELVDGADLGDLPDGLDTPLKAFRELVAELPGIAEERGPDGAFFWLWTKAPSFRGLVADPARGRDVDALAALGDVLSRFRERRPEATVQDYLDTLDAAEFGPDPWVPPEERRPFAVRVLSAHRAHGTEFDQVMVVGCLEGEFPSLAHGYPLLDLESLVDPKTGPQRLRERLAEERALFRLAVSRARRRTILFASHSSSARNPRTPSRFAGRIGASWNSELEFAAGGASLRSMESALRRRLADVAAAPASRIAALAALPLVGAAPAGWWWGRDWTDPGVPMHPGSINTSYSRLSVLENCALQYLYSAELGLDPDKTHHMWVGTLIHGIIDRVQRGELARDEESVLAALDEQWRADQFPNRALERQRYQDSRQMLRRWLRDRDLKELEVVRSEEAFSFPIDGAVVRGRIDAILRQGNGRLRVLDYKTGRNPVPQKTISENLQLAAYYLALRRTPELRELGDPEIVELAFLGKEARGTFTIRSHRPRPGYEEWAEGRLLELLTEVREERFAPSAEADCQWCSFKTLCPVWREGGEVQG